MRIIAGEWRGTTIAAPKGMNTRPTIDRARESLMSSLFYTLDGFDGVTVLDAFAGSGALGLEALSRGASQAWFYEQNQDSFNTLQANIQKVHCDVSRAITRKMDIFAHPPLAGHEPFGLILFDPPYAYDPEPVIHLLEQLDEADALAGYVTISYEHDKDVNLASYLEKSSIKWELITQKCFGDTVIDIFGKEDE